MPTMVRLIHETGAQFDVPLAPHPSLEAYCSMLRADGYIALPGAYFPYPRLSLVLTYETEMQRGQPLAEGQKMAGSA